MKRNMFPGAYSQHWIFFNGVRDESQDSYKLAIPLSLSYTHSPEPGTLRENPGMRVVVTTVIESRQCLGGLVVDNMEKIETCIHFILWLHQRFIGSGQI